MVADYISSNGGLIHSSVLSPASCTPLSALDDVIVRWTGKVKQQPIIIPFLHLSRYPRFPVSLVTIDFARLCTSTNNQ